jgi:K+-sensing histidine kinase KdpD
MLEEARRRAGRGTDVVVGLVETHGRPHTAAMLDGLEVVPRRALSYRGVDLTELDLDAVLARRPEVAVVDELAHTNVPGCRHEKRRQDVQDLLDAGIDVLTTVNVQHLESHLTALDELAPAAVAVTTDIPADLPAANADPGLLERVLVNIVANALRHSPPGRPPTITASAHAGQVELRVIDTGPGIPEDQWEHVFLPFQLLGDRDNRTGVGLGLALSRGLAEAMGGSITPETTPGGGLTMVLRLPAAPEGGAR